MTEFEDPAPSAPIPSAGRGVLAPVQRRVIGWDPETGAPSVELVPMVTKAQAEATVSATAALPYDGPELEFQGLSNLEVALIRQAQGAARGDREDLKEIMDRIAGKPKQTSEVMKVTMTYEEKLKQIAGRRSTQARVVDAQVVPPSRDAISEFE